MIKGIAHICISTRDLDATEAFYCSGLGLTRKFDFIRNGKVFGFYLQINDHNFIEVFQADTSSSETDPQVKHFCLEVDDIDKTIKEIRACDIEITDKKKGRDNSWQAWLVDPNGIRIELHEYTAESSQIVGADCVMP